MSYSSKNSELAAWFFDDSNYRCILLLEDLDAAFTQGLSRDSTSTGAPMMPSDTGIDDGFTLSLSGLLNSLDGVAAEEGR